MTYHDGEIQTRDHKIHVSTLKIFVGQKNPITYTPFWLVSFPKVWFWFIRHQKELLNKLLFLPLHLYTVLHKYYYTIYFYENCNICDFIYYYIFPIIYAFLAHLVLYVQRQMCGWLITVFYLM